MKTWYEKIYGEPAPTKKKVEEKPVEVKRTTRDLPKYILQARQDYLKMLRETK